VLIERPLSQARIQARDRRRAAMHEAGHFAIAVHLGLHDVSAWIHQTGIEDVMQGKSWVGHTQYPSGGFTLMSAQRRRMIGVAGFVAEEAWDSRHDFDPCWEDLLWDPAAMSTSDWATAGCDPGNPNQDALRAVDAVAALFHPGVGALWAPLLSVARLMIQENEVRTQWGCTVPRHRLRGEIAPGR
jgi:hypothetical protein